MPKNLSIIRLCNKRAKHFIWRKNGVCKNPSPFGKPIALKFGPNSDMNVAHDVLFFETSNHLKSSYDAWDSTPWETETGLSDTIHTLEPSKT